MGAGLLVVFVLLISSAPALAESHGSYGVHVPGFGKKTKGGVTTDQGHYDQVGALAGCTNPSPGELYRGGAPDFANPNSRKTLLASHIGFVVDLRIEGAKNKTAEEKKLLENGIGYINIPMTTEEPIPDKVKVHLHIPAHRGVAAEVRDVTVPTLDALNMATQFIRDRLQEKTNVFVHCAHGEDRTGTVVGRLRDCAAWKSEFTRYGGTFYKPLQKIFATSAVASVDFNNALKHLDPNLQCSH